MWPTHPSSVRLTAPLKSTIGLQMVQYRNAREFLKAVEAQYRALFAYSDYGFTRRTVMGRTRSVVFETAFLAKDRFRFEFSSPHPYRKLAHRKTRDVVGLDALGPYHYSEDYDGVPSLERPDTWEIVIGGATGISSGTAHTIGVLLFEEIGGLRLVELKRPRFRRFRMIDGVRCVTISGLHPWGRGRITAWFGADDLLLRRLLRHRMKSEEMRCNVRTVFTGNSKVFDAPSLAA
jgi:hypothetical protein